ncbi:MAG TPA: transcription antitermination factor NusB [Treponemataceae bacterium]|nr:transcription antitermination factor NusB [Treponemataceae bacterium]HOQ92713.1 transcription antitermination factor NusB [Treponemataceae bacterium]HPM05382.1 transcription antitermination factor NusB [Treponemataceae bacterium]HUH44871.1 transcription antitermination factor NusB [Treponemataceae bacterium]
MSRRKARILAFQALYSFDVGKMDSEQLVSLSWVESKSLEKLSESSNLYTRLLIAGTLENLEEIDENISKNLTNWDFERLNRVDLAILRISAYALLYQKDLHPSIVIDEAVQIAKEFGSDDSFKFINAVLDNIQKKEV